MTELIYGDIREIEESGFEQLLESLPEKRRDRTRLFRQHGDQLRSAMAGLLAGELLSRHGIEASLLDHDEKGRPFIVGREELCVTITHSGAYAACALSEHGPAGVDIQEHSGGSETMLKRCFNDGERTYVLEAGSLEEQRARFYEVFSKKECLIKVYGLKDHFRDIDTLAPEDGMRFCSYPLPGYAFILYTKRGEAPEAPERYRLGAPREEHPETGRSGAETVLRAEPDS